MTEGSKRIVATLLVFVALVVANGAAMVLVFARGLDFLVGPWGAVVQAPFVGVLALATFAILRKFRGFGIEALGLRLPGTWRWGGATMLLGLAIPVVVSLVLVAAGQGAMTPGPGVGAAILVTGLVSFVVNAVFQQLGLLGLALASSPTPRLSNTSIVLSSALFTATHFAPGAAPVYFANVFLFGVACCLLFRRDEGPAWSSAIGFHAGTNVAMTLVSGGFTTNAPPTLLGWRGLDTTWSGGAAGLEAGFALLVIHVVLVGVLARRGFVERVQ